MSGSLQYVHVNFKNHSYEDLGYIVSTTSINSMQLVWIQSALIHQNSVQLLNYHSVIVLKNHTCTLILKNN